MDVGTALDGEVGAGWCPHLAILVPSAERVIPALASFYGLGARRNGLLFHRALPGHGEADRAGLTAAGLDVAALEGNGRLVVAEPPHETDPERWARPWVPVVEDALEHGFDAVWFSRFPIGPNEAHLTAALAFDRAWDDAFHGRPAVSLCVYIVDDVDEAARARRVETLAPFHDGVVVPDARGGAELVRTRGAPRPRGLSQPGFRKRAAGRSRQRVTRERIVLLRPRTVISVAFVLLGLAVAIWIVWVSIRVLTWVFVAVFLALALDPAVRFLQQHGMRRRGAAAAVIYTSAIAVLGLLAALLLPPLINQAEGLADAAPEYVEDITAGRGPLGFLQRDYQLVDRIREATENREGSPLGSAGTLIEFGRGVLTTIVGIVTIVFLTLFMILEGPKWIERGLGLMPREQRPRWRNVGQQIAGTVSGYVTGNLALSLIAGTSSTIVLLIMGVPFALALGLIVAILDLIPLAGATLAGILLTTVGLLTSVTAGIVLLVFFVLYQQLENHVLQPLVYGRTVQLSPLVVLIAILIGTEVAGILGALGAIPVAGTMQIVLLDWLRHRRIEQEGGAAAIAAEAVEDGA